MCTESRVKITGEPIPASQFVVNNILYPKLPEMAASKRYEWSHNRNRGQDWRKNRGALHKLFREKGVCLIEMFFRLT